MEDTFSCYGVLTLFSVLSQSSRCASEYLQSITSVKFSVESFLDENHQSIEERHT